MINRTDLQALSAPQKANLIYSQARTALADRLWQAALGDHDKASDDSTAASSAGMDFESLLALFDREYRETSAAMPPAGASAPGNEAAPGGETSTGPVEVQAGGLGPNARYQPVLASAAERTGIPAPALAAIVQAEAGKGADGSWQCFSRNPRSSAAGLGQFLSGTWEHMAETEGTWLNSLARQRGWLDGRGCVSGAARSDLLALRYDAQASINTIADYARQNLNGLRNAGIDLGADATSLARAAYMGHHLGLGDAIRFLKGGLDPARAAKLLNAQIGHSKASQEIAAAGDAASAHRQWLMSYLDRHVRPDRFAA